MRSKIRRTIVLISLLLFPVTLNFFSPYVSIHGAINGIVSGSLIVFFIMFLTGLFFGRAWCAWVCPMACLSEICLNINNKPVNIKRLKIIRYSIYTVWAGILVGMFVLAGGIRGIDPLHLTENIISVDMPQKYVIYYGVLAIFTILTLTVGRRGACHSICWMSPFLVAGFTLGKMLRFPQLRILADTKSCIKCGKCNQKCPMSIDVRKEVQDGMIKTSDCILCGECVDICPKDVLSFGKN